MESRQLRILTPNGVTNYAKDYKKTMAVPFDVASRGHTRVYIQLCTTVWNCDRFPEIQSGDGIFLSLGWTR